LRRRGPWMAGMSRANVIMAAVIVVILVLVTSPALDPRRLSVANQMARLHSGAVTAARFDYDYFRFNLGRYGNDALIELAKDANKQIAGFASASLARQARYADSGVAPAAIASRVEFKPDGATLDPAFIKYLEDAATARSGEHPFCLTHRNAEVCLMLALDLNGDGEAEIIALNSYPQVVYGKSGGQWKKIGMLSGNRMLTRQQLTESINEARFGTEAKMWNDVWVGDARYTVLPAR